MTMAETKVGHSSINLEGKLGLEARISGGSAFGQLIDAFTDRLNQEPTFADVLQTYVDYTHSKETRARELRFNGKSQPKLLSEKLLGTWVSLAAEHTLLDEKKMPDEADGARWIALDGQVARLEDAILVAHRGQKSVTPDEQFIKIIADPTGDTQKKIADSLDEVAQALSATTTRAAIRVLPVAVAGAMIFSSCGPKPPTITPETTRPAITQPAPTVEFTVTPTRRPATETRIPAPEVLFKVFPTSGLEKASMTTKLDDALISQVDATHAPNAKTLLRGIIQRIHSTSPETTKTSIDQMEVMYMRIVNPKTGYMLEVAFAPLATEGNQEFAFVSFFNDKGKIMTGGAVWNPSEELPDGKTVGTLRFLGPDANTLGDPIYAIYADNGTIKVILYDINDPTNLDKALILDAGKTGKLDLSESDIAQSVDFIRALQLNSILPIIDLFSPAQDLKVGIGEDGKIPLNQVDLSARFADANNDGHMDGIPQTQLDAELAYLAAHPEITGQGNYVDDAVEGSTIQPYRTLYMVIEKNNVIAINQDSNNPDLLEIVFTQSNPDGTARSIVHVLIDPKAQEHYIKDSPDIETSRAHLFINNIEQFLNGAVNKIRIAPFMNSVANPDLIDDPAFARVRQVVEEEGDDLAALNLFTKGYFLENINDQKKIINTSTFISPYAIIP